MRTNLYAMFWITKAAIPHMPPGSAIINTSSVNAYEPSANLLDYALTKAGIANFTKGLAKQMIKRGIRVNAVAPGPFWTALQVTRRTDAGKRAEVRGAGADGSPWAAHRNCTALRGTRIRAGELRDRAGVRRVRWCGQSLRAVAVTHWLASLLA